MAFRWSEAAKADFPGLFWDGTVNAHTGLGSETTPSTGQRQGSDRLLGLLRLLLHGVHGGRGSRVQGAKKPASKKAASTVTKKSPKKAGKKKTKKSKR